MALTRRKVGKTTTKSTGTPKKTEAPEPEIYTEKGAVSVADKTEPLLGKCAKCKVMPSNSEVDHFCYGCRMEEQGFEFDAEKLRFIKRVQRTRK